MRKATQQGEPSNEAGTGGGNFRMNPSVSDLQETPLPIIRSDHPGRRANNKRNKRDAAGSQRKTEKTTYEK